MSSRPDKNNGRIDKHTTLEILGAFPASKMISMNLSGPSPGSVFELSRSLDLKQL